MAKNDATNAPEAPTAFPLTLTEFCQDLSRTVKQPEMIYAFSKSEEAAGRVRDLASAFQSRFDAFGKQIPA